MITCLITYTSFSVTLAILSSKASLVECLEAEIIDLVFCWWMGWEPRLLLCVLFGGGAGNQDNCFVSFLVEGLVAKLIALCAFMVEGLGSDIIIMCALISVLFSKVSLGGGAGS